MLMTNLDTSQGLTNGSRLKVLEINETFLKYVLLSGSKKGNIAFIPKIKNIGESKKIPFTLI